MTKKSPYKVSKADPMGICSFSDGEHAVAVCPVRFLEGGRIFRDAGRLAFGEAVKIGIFPEVRILTTVGKDGQPGKKIGKVDFLLGKIIDGKVVDFAAVEVQAVYMSGKLCPCASLPLMISLSTRSRKFYHFNASKRAP